MPILLRCRMLFAMPAGNETANHTLPVTELHVSVNFNFMANAAISLLVTLTHHRMA